MCRVFSTDVPGLSKLSDFSGPSLFHTSDFSDIKPLTYAGIFRRIHSTPFCNALQYRNFPAVITPSIMEISDSKSFPIPEFSDPFKLVPHCSRRTFPALNCKFRRPIRFIFRFEIFDQLSLYLNSLLFIFNTSGNQKA
jgi:hypothetical protein